MKRDHVGRVSKCWLDALVCWPSRGPYMVYVHRTRLMRIPLLGGSATPRSFTISTAALLASSTYHTNPRCVAYQASTTDNWGCQRTQARSSHSLLALKIPL